MQSVAVVAVVLALTTAACGGESEAELQESVAAASEETASAEAEICTELNRLTEEGSLTQPEAWSLALTARENGLETMFEQLRHLSDGLDLHGPDTQKVESAQQELDGLCAPVRED